MRGKKSIDLSSVRKGGFWSPKFKSESNCGTNDVEFIVFIIPYMNREDNLNVFIHNIHNYLINANKYPFEYRIIIAEQKNNTHAIY